MSMVLAASYDRPRFALVEILTMRSDTGTKEKEWPFIGSLLIKQTSSTNERRPFMKRQPTVYLMLSLAIAISTLWLSQSQGYSTGQLAPEITNDTWVNSAPLRLTDLRGKVVLVEFWTFGCYNCQNVEPYVKSWHDKFKDRGLVVIGVHSPEFNHERVLKNVQNYVREHGIQYALAIDNDYKTWNSYQNHYWPARYLIDKKGVIRQIRIGEGGYDQTEKEIRELLAEPYTSNRSTLQE